METIVNKIYPVFEADQVLSNKHLNNLIAYLEEQERATRTCLLGLGIVCGLKIKLSDTKNSITITEGTAVTSLGFLIKFKESTFTHFKDTDLSKNFLEPPLDNHDYFKELFQHRSNYDFLESTDHLLPNSTDSTGIINAINIENKVVILLLETQLIDNKNCTGTNCDDKGKRLEFNIKPILVDQSWVKTFPNNALEKIHFKKLALPRFNVPKTNLVTGNSIFNEYNNIISQITSNTSNAVANLYDHYKPILNSVEDISNLQAINTTLQSVLSNHLNFNIQYVYDWLSDIISTYNELVEYCENHPEFCCANTSLFPFHVSLGVAYHNTNTVNTSVDLLSLMPFRNVFIKTGIIASLEKEKRQRFNSLFIRLSKIVDAFEVDTKLDLKITPSILGEYSLGEKAIPFYYDNENVSKLNEVWNYNKTKTFRNDEILSYHASEYSNTNETINPLSYNIEPYNFYRIEGHIGKVYQKTIAEIEAIRKQNRLAFKVIGINAVNPANKTLDINSITGEWDDLEFDYDLAKEKVFNITEFVIIWIKANANDIRKEYPLFTVELVGRLENILKESRSLLAEDLNDFLPDYTKFYEVFEGLNDLFLSHRMCIFASIKTKSSVLLEDLIDHLDEINSLFLEDPFTILFEEAERRIKESITKTFFSNFAEEHAGLEHKAGVTKGGTFVLVYSDYSVFKARPSGLKTKFLISNINKMVTSFEFTAKQKKSIKSLNVVRSRRLEKAKLKVGEAPNKAFKETTAKIRSNIKANLTRNFKANFSKELFDHVNVNLDQFFDLNVAQAPINDTTLQKVILADFYLPYLCCGDGDTINIVINNDTPTTTPGIADFNNPDFNNLDFNTNDPIA